MSYFLLRAPYTERVSLSCGLTSLSGPRLRRGRRPGERRGCGRVFLFLVALRRPGRRIDARGTTSSGEGPSSPSLRGSPPVLSPPLLNSARPFSSPEERV